VVRLVQSAGVLRYQVLKGKRTRPDARLYAGSGKVDEIRRAAEALNAMYVVFNHALSPAQERNLEKVIVRRVMDRTELILEIFAQRAQTSEGKLQVELAQLQHLSTRLVRGWTHLERQRGGLGKTGGPGETQLELDRRYIGSRVKTLKAKLVQLKKQRSIQRRARARRDVLSISLVGYTNAGKSTLFNALTGARTYASSKLFATLDPTLRRLDLPDSRAAVLADTVGFVRDLPHDLVAAFRATLEEARESQLLLHVIDAADPERLQRIEQVEAVLDEIGAAGVPRLEVYNKIDLKPDETARVERDEAGVPVRVHASALSGAGLDLLRAAVAERIGPLAEELELSLPPAAARLRARLFAEGAVRSERIDAGGGYHLRVSMPRERLRRALRDAGLEPHAVGL
jgi:GTP-binding protein HflX